jgi:acetyl esterase
MAHGFCSLSDRVAVAEEALSAVAADVRERL